MTSVYATSHKHATVDPGDGRMAHSVTGSWSPGGSALVISGQRAQDMTEIVRFLRCTHRRRLPTMVHEEWFGGAGEAPPASRRMRWSGCLSGQPGGTTPASCSSGPPS